MLHGAAGGLGLKARSTKVTAARTLFPFTRASSAGLTGKRVIGCLRSEATSFMTPRQTEQRSEPAGPRSRVPGGIAKGAGQAAPFGSPEKAKGEQESGVVSEPTVRCCWPHGHGMPWPYTRGVSLPPVSYAEHRSHRQTLLQAKKAQHPVLRLSRLSRQQTYLPISASTSAMRAFSVAISAQRSVAWPTLRPALKALP